MFELRNHTDRRIFVLASTLKSGKNGNGKSWKELQNLKSAIEFCEELGHPCLVRPPYILSEAALKVANNNLDLENYL